MSTGLVFFYICAAFVCKPNATVPGDGIYYDTRADCRTAAVAYAKERHISLGRWEIICIERERPQ